MCDGGGVVDMGLQWMVVVVKGGGQVTVDGSGGDHLGEGFVIVVDGAQGQEK